MYQYLPPAAEKANIIDSIKPYNYTGASKLESPTFDDFYILFYLNTTVVCCNSLL